MNSLQLVHIEEKESLLKHFNDYLTELAEFDPDIQFDENGDPIYKWFNNYFTDKERYAFFYKIDGEIAGLAMVRHLGENSFELAEFYVLPTYRKNGNSLYFATELLKLFRGTIHISTRHTNPRAVKFWTKFTKGYDIVFAQSDDIWMNWSVIVQ